MPGARRPAKLAERAHRLRPARLSVTQAVCGRPAGHCAREAAEALPASLALARRELGGQVRALAARRVSLVPHGGMMLLQRAAGQAPRGRKPETATKSSAVRAPPCGLGGVQRAVARPTAAARRPHAAHRHRADRADAAAVQPGPHLPERRHCAHCPGVWLGARTAGERASSLALAYELRGCHTLLPSTAPCRGPPLRSPQPEPRAARAAGRRAVGLPVGLHGDAAAGRHARGPLRRCAGGADLPHLDMMQPPCARSVGRSAGGPAAWARDRVVLARVAAAAGRALRAGAPQRGPPPPGARATPPS